MGSFLIDAVSAQQDLNLLTQAGGFDCFDGTAHGIRCKGHGTLHDNDRGPVFADGVHKRFRACIDSQIDQIQAAGQQHTGKNIFSYVMNVAFYGADQNGRCAGVLIPGKNRDLIRRTLQSEDTPEDNAGHDQIRDEVFTGFVSQADQVHANQQHINQLFLGASLLTKHSGKLCNSAFVEVAHGIDKIFSAGHDRILPFFGLCLHYTTFLQEIKQFNAACARCACRVGHFTCADFWLLTSRRSGLRRRFRCSLPPYRGAFRRFSFH